MSINDTIYEEQVNGLLLEFLALPLLGNMLERLGKELSPELCYHSLTHTKDVLSEALLFGVVDRLTKRELLILSVAAVYHDAGFLIRRDDNEILGAQMAKEAMIQQGGFLPTEIELVFQMISDSKLIDSTNGIMQTAHTNLSRYLLDADLGNLGRDDFFSKLELLNKENGISKSDGLKATMALIRNHRWLTNAARQLRQKKEEDNLTKLKALIATAGS